MKRYRMLINGEWVESERKGYFPVLDPPTQEVIAEAPEATAHDVNRAVAAARDAFDSGPCIQTTAQERGRILLRLAERIRKETPMLAWKLAPAIAAVWSRDIFKAFRIVKAIRAGIVWVNHMQPTYVEAPWGGYKQSGFGRGLGPWGIEECLETKQVHINLNEQPIGWHQKQMLEAWGR